MENQNNQVMVEEIKNEIDPDIPNGVLYLVPDGTPKISDIINSKSSQELLDALYFIWDAADRSQTLMFLRGDTATCVKEDKELTGEKVEVGIRRNEWWSGQGNIFRDFMNHELRGWDNNNDEFVTYVYHGVPIEIKLYDENPTLMDFNPVFYRYESFLLPNPYDEFKEKYE